METRASVYTFRGFELSPREQRLTRDGARVPLSPKAFELLVWLVEHRGRLVEKQELLSALWPDTFVEEANLSVHVAAVRKALSAGADDCIETVPKRGYRFVAPVQRIGGDPAEARAAAVRLTVLPLRTRNVDPDTEFIAYSLPDAIAGSVAEHPWLIVRTPHVTSGDRAVDADTADAVLQGTLTGSGGDARLRINLVAVPAGTVLLSRELTPSLDGLFELQADIARDVSRVLARNAALPVTETAPAAVQPGAYVFYLRANQLAYETSHWTMACELYEAAVREDPSYAPAWARLARCYRVIGKFAEEPADARRFFDRARDGFERALGLDAGLSIAHSLYAQLEVDTGQATQAMTRLLRLVHLRPHAAELYSGLVHALRYCGLLDLSVAAHARARVLDPTHPTSVHHTWWMKGEYERALGETFGDIGYMPGLALASLGRSREAIAALQWRERESGHTRVTSYIASLRALLEHNREDSLRAADQAVARLADAEAIYYMARTYAWWGEVSRALDLMTQVVDGGFVCHLTFDRDPWLNSIRQEPRFVGLLAQARERSAEAERLFVAAGGPQLV